MLPSNDLGTPRKRVTTGGTPYVSNSGNDVFRATFAKPPPHRVSASSSTSPKRHMVVAAAIGSFVLVAVVIGAAVGVTVAKKNAMLFGGVGTLDAAYCNALPDGGETYCLSYYNSASKDRFAAASQWQKMSSITCEFGGGGS